MTLHSRAVSRQHLRMEMKPGDYAIFAQTRSVMRGWPKSEHDDFRSVSDLVVTSSNIRTSRSFQMWQTLILADISVVASAAPAASLQIAIALVDPCEGSLECKGMIR
jgi:hypothetical protein